jgi:chromosome segregation ATPase
VAGLGLLAFAIIDEYTAADAATVAQNRLNKAISEAKAATDAEKEAVAKLVQEIRSETTTKGEKARAIEELKRISPEYFGQLDIEKTKTEDLAGAVDEYNQSLQRLTLQKLNQESLEAQLELEKLNKQLELAQLTAKQTAGQFGTGAGIGVNQTITRLENRKDELIATINALAEASKAEIDVLSKGPEVIDAPTVATPTKTDIPVQVKFNLEGIGQNADNAKALFEQMDREAAIFNESLAVTQQLAQSGFAALIADDFKALSENITIAKNPLTELSESFAALEDRSLLFGDSFDLLSEKINATKSAIQSALEEGFAPTSSTIEGLTEVLAGLTTQFEAQQAAIEATKVVTEAYTTAFNSSVNDQIKGFADVGRAALGAAAKVVKAKIQEATVNFIADAFAKFGVFGAIAAAGAGAIVGGVVSKAFSALNIPALAEGGITTGPTLALIGEGRENEVVLPLSKLNNIIDNSQPQERLLATVGIDELYIALERYKRENGRVN